MAIGGLLLNKTYSFGGNSAESVEKLVAVSRCYRAESSRVQAEKGIYRVHHFTKVEMFAITPPNIEVSDGVSNVDFLRLVLKKNITVHAKLDLLKSTRSYQMAEFKYRLLGGGLKTTSNFGNQHI